MENNKKVEKIIKDELKDTFPEEEIEKEDSTARNETLKKENEELLGRLLRMQADFDNYRRRSRKELAEMAQWGSEKVILELLPVIDNFERALLAVKDNPELEQFVTGMEMIYRQLKGVLEKEGLCEIKAINEPFDPEKHHAVAQIPTMGCEDNIVVEEIQKGYLLNDKVLRVSTVCVAKKEDNS